MPTDPSQFARARLPWSRWKHEILINYLQVMAAVLRSYGLIFYVDGFAGPGKYVEDGIEGSPLLAARHAKGLSYSHRDYDLRCINVEFDKSVFDDLQCATKPFADYVENHHGSFSQFVPEILQRIGDQPTLFFLDPIGIVDLTWESLTPIFERRPVTELLIRFDAQTAARLTGEGKHLHKSFNSVLGEADSKYWTRYVTDLNLRLVDKKSRLTRAYEDKLREYFEFVARIPIRSSDNQLKYYMLYATRNLKGMQVMNDVVNKVQDLRSKTLEDEHNLRTGAYQTSLFTEQDLKGTELPALKQAIEQEMSDGEPVLRANLRARVAMLEDNLGRYSMSQFTAALGGRSRGITVPDAFENLRARIQIHNNKTLGVDTVEISLNR